MIALAAVLALLQAPLDSGVFVVRQDTVEIARESFRLLPSPAGGFTLTATTRYDRGRPVVVLAPLVAFTADSQLATLQYDVADPREPVRILGQLGRGRVTLRYLGHAIERAREFPAGAVTLVLDDSVFDRPDGHLFACCPQLKKPQDVDRLWKGLHRGEVSVISTDTCTFTRGTLASATLQWVT